MSNYRYLASAVTMTLLLALAFVGCQKGSVSNPVTPGTGEGANPALTGGAGGHGGSATAPGPRSNSHAVWGLWNIEIDAETLEATIIPLRGAEWHANVVEFMQKPYPPSNLGIFIDQDAGDIPNGLFAVDVKLTHPFPGAPRFRGFDVRGGFLADGSYASAHDASGTFANPNPTANEARLLNADGYMRWFNPREFTLGGIRILEYIPGRLGTTNMVSATLNPYKYFSDDFLSLTTKELTLQEMDINVATRGTFSVTSSITRRYMIQFPFIGGNPVFKFTYVIDASYAEPVEDDPTFPVESYSISANMQEVYKIVCTDNGGTAYYVSSGSYGGNLRFDLELFDWQAPYNPSGVLGEIDRVLVESPTLLGNYGGRLDLTDTFRLNAAPATETSSVAMIEILDATPAATSNQVLFLTVTSKDPSDYSNPFGNPYPIQPILAAYYMWSVPIASTPFNTPPTVGQVEGDDYVDGTEGPLNYFAPISDPESPPQVLTATWSVVDSGSPPSYTIPSNPDLSVDIDWAGYTPDQDYDVNVRVFDGYDYAQGTLLTVTYSTANTPPTVGQVSGPNPVQVDDTAAVYTAPISDPDVPPQVLTVLWSVVTAGSSPSYVIPAESDYSLLQDWSTYEVDDYDVNVQVDDGNAPPVEGTKLTVALENTPPTLGDITGKTPVNETDTSEQYSHGTMTDPDNGQNHTYMWSLVPYGSAANYNLTPNGPNDSLIVNWCNYAVGQWTMRCRVDDGYDTGESNPFTVVRGLSVCPGGDAHSYSGLNSQWSKFSIIGFVPNGWPGTEDPLVLDGYMLPRMDMDFFASGDFAGQGVMQAGPNVLMNFTADATNPYIHDPTTQYKWRIPGMGFYDSDWFDSIPCNPRVVLSLDTSPDLNSGDAYYDNRIVIVTSHDHDVIYVLDADSTNPNNPPMATLTNVSGTKGIECVAIDRDDDIWALVRGSDDQFRLHHWTYILDNGTGGPYYSYNSGDTLNLNSQLGTEEDIFDMVVAFANNHLYIFEAGPSPSRGVIHKINLNNSPPTYVTSQNQIFQSTIDTSIQYRYLVWNGSGTDTYFRPYGGDISIDHVYKTNCDPEQCRLEVMGKLTTGNTHVVRLDLDMSNIDSNSSTDTKTFFCYGFSTDVDEGDRILVCPPYVLQGEPPDYFDVTEYYFYYWVPPTNW